MSLINMSSMYNKTPAEMLSIKDEYTSYCLNEACAYITNMIKLKKQPKFKKKYKSFSDLYNSIM